MQTLSTPSSTGHVQTLSTPSSTGHVQTLSTPSSTGYAFKTLVTRLSHEAAVATPQFTIVR